MHMWLVLLGLYSSDVVKSFDLLTRGAGICNTQLWHFRIDPPESTIRPTQSVLPVSTVNPYQYMIVKPSSAQHTPSAQFFLTSEFEIVM